jgi:hypothetical protein
MWQKLNPTGIDTLENTRIHIHKVVQLVSAAARCYLPVAGDDQNALLSWVAANNALSSMPFGPGKNFQVSLDIKKFVLTISKKHEAREHLVLSGMTYPLAFGWLQVKLDKMGLDSEMFTDATPYSMTNYGFDHSKELGISEKGAEEYAKYFSNAWDYLGDMAGQFEVQGNRYCWPEHMELAINVLSGKKKTYKVGFSPGDENYIEPYCFVSTGKKTKVKNGIPEIPSAIWHNKDWNGYVLLISKIYHTEPERERSNIDDFIKEAISGLDHV